MEQAAHSFVRHDGTIRPLAEIELLAIRHALQRCAGASEAARQLGIGRSTLYRKMDEVPELKKIVPLDPLPQIKIVVQPKTIPELVHGMKDEKLEDIQRAIDLRFGLRMTLGEIAYVLFH